MPEATGPYLFSVIDDSNIDALAPEMSSCHAGTRGETLSPAAWRWRYVDNPAGGGACAVALRENHVVGVLGNAYLRFCRGGEAAIGGIVGDLSILESERSWACYAGLLQASAERAISDRTAFGYGFVSRSAVGATPLLGTRLLGRVPIYTGFLSIRSAMQGRGANALACALAGLAQPLLGLKRRPARKSGLDVRVLDGVFAADVDDLWQSIAPRHTVAVVRDAAYLNWRYVQRPGADYVRLLASVDGRTEGVAVFRVRPEQRKAYLLELLAGDDERATHLALLDAVLSMLSEQGVGLLTACFPSGSAEAAALRMLRFQRWPGRFWHVGLTVTDDLGWGAGPELDMGNWYFSLGDWLTH